MFANLEFDIRILRLHIYTHDAAAVIPICVVTTQDMCKEPVGDLKLAGVDLAPRVASSEGRQNFEAPPIQLRFVL